MTDAAGGCGSVDAVTETIPAVLFRLTYWGERQAAGLEEEARARSLHEAVRGWWVVGQRRDDVAVAMAVVDGKVAEVYRVERWEPWTAALPDYDPTSRPRWAFVGEPDPSLADLRGQDVSGLAGRGAPPTRSATPASTLTPAPSSPPRARLAAPPPAGTAPPRRHRRTRALRPRPTGRRARRPAASSTCSPTGASRAGPPTPGARSRETSWPRGCGWSRRSPTPTAAAVSTLPPRRWLRPPPRRDRAPPCPAARRCGRGGTAGRSPWPPERRTCAPSSWR